MATAKLIASSYYVSSSYLSLTDEQNLYTDTSSTTYATLTNTHQSTSYYYFYLRGFDIGSIPSNAIVNSFTVKLRGRASGAYNSAMYLCHGTNTIANATATQIPNSSSAATRTFAHGSLTWAQIVSYGNDFGIRINCRRNAKNTQSYYYIYGAEIIVDYTMPAGNAAYIKTLGQWVAATHVWKKISGAWTEQTISPEIFDADTKYKGS